MQNDPLTRFGASAAFVAGGLFFALSGVLGPGRLPWLLLAVPCSAVAFVASGVVFHSLAFWLGRIQSLSRSLFELTISFSLYPPALFEGSARALLFTVLPAYLPVELLRQPSASTALLAAFGTLSYAAFALWLFQRGLRRYCSGSRITTGARGVGSRESLAPRLAIRSRAGRGTQKVPVSVARLASS